MDLKKYLKIKNIYVQEFAKILKINPQTLTNYLHGRRKPNLEIACKIENMTEGKVTIHDLMETWESFQTKN